MSASIFKINPNFWIQGSLKRMGGVSMESNKQDRILEIFFRGLRGEDCSLHR